ncbi:MAG: lysophospholipid acyltransferase family protein [Planctomycetota bacterium]
MRRAGPWAFLDRVLYKCVQLALRGLFRLWFGFRVEGDVPDDGPLIVAANHSSFLDALLVGTASRRRLRFLMTDQFRGHPLLRWFGAWSRVIYVREEGLNRDMFRQALEALGRGEALGIFPEGAISRDGALQELQPGILALAQRRGVPVVPMGLSGPFAALPRHRRFPRPATIRVRIGAPIPAAELFPAGLDRDAALAHGARVLEDALRALGAGAVAATPDGPRPSTPA